MKDNRSYRTTYFATVPDWLIGAVSPAALAVYAAIDRFADRNGRAFPHRKTIAEKAGCSEATVKRALAELEKIGALDRTQREAEHGGLTSNEYALRREPPSAHIRPDPGSDSSLSRASITGVNLTRETNERTTPVGPPLLAPMDKTVDRKAVTMNEHRLAESLLLEFNDVFGTKLSLKAWGAKFVMRIREHPELSREQHRELMERNARSPWWKGPPSPSVIYGNAAVFERAMMAGSGGGSVSSAVSTRIADEEVERMRVEREGVVDVEGEVVREEDE